MFAEIGLKLGNWVTELVTKFRQQTGISADNLIGVLFIWDNGCRFVLGGDKH